MATDARVAEIHGINPYLPSKYSDYLGSGSKIWAITEAGSMLSEMPVDAQTHLGDIDGARNILLEMVAAKNSPLTP